MLENGFSPIRNAPMADYPVKKKSATPYRDPSKLEKNDFSVRSQKDSSSINEKRPLPPKPYGKI